MHTADTAHALQLKWAKAALAGLRERYEQAQRDVIQLANRVREAEREVKELERERA